MDPTEINRRAFLATAAAAVTCACAFSCPLALAEQRPPDGASDPIDVGPLADFKTDGPDGRWAKSHKILLVRNDDRLYAPTAICTHKKAVLQVEDGQIICPKHDSPFDNRGVPLPQTADGEETPATEPLHRYAIFVNAGGHVLVDKSKRFDQAQWDDPASFVKIEAAAK